MKTMISDLSANRLVTSLFVLRALIITTSWVARVCLEMAPCDESGQVIGYLWDNLEEALEGFQEDSSEFPDEC